MYTPIGSLTHGSIFKNAPDGTRRWRVRRHTEDYSFCTPLDLDTAERISRDDVDDMFNERSMVWVDDVDRDVTWILANDVGAYSVTPPRVYCNCGRIPACGGRLCKGGLA